MKGGSSTAGGRLKAAADALPDIRSVLALPEKWGTWNSPPLVASTSDSVDQIKLVKIRRGDGSRRPCLHGPTGLNDAYGLDRLPHQLRIDEEIVMSQTTQDRNKALVLDAF